MSTGAALVAVDRDLTRATSQLQGAGRAAAEPLADALTDGTAVPERTVQLCTLGADIRAGLQAARWPGTSVVGSTHLRLQLGDQLAEFHFDLRRSKKRRHGP